MKEIPLSSKNEVNNNGKYSATVDDDLYDDLIKYNWSISSNGYAQRRIIKPDGSKSTILMHRQIMELTFGDSDYVDHINGNRLDNQKSNLRLCTHTQNLHNSKISKRNKSGAKGVFHQHIEYETKKKGIVCKDYWRASIMVNRKNIFLGTFPYNPNGFAQAKKAYNDAAKKYYGQFAYLNP